MSKDCFRLKAVKVLPDHRLLLSYADRQVLEADLREWIGAGKTLRGLKSARSFADARMGAGGRSVDWAEAGLDLAADNLRNLAIEQSGGIGHERIWNWLHDNGLTLEQGAEALGISRRMLIYYRSGEKPIPRTVWLACLGWEVLKRAKGRSKACFCGRLPPEIKRSHPHA
jgi:hypothetical protein